MTTIMAPPPGPIQSVAPQQAPVQNAPVLRMAPAASPGAPPSPLQNALQQPPPGLTMMPQGGQPQQPGLNPQVGPNPTPQPPDQQAKLQQYLQRFGGQPPGQAIAQQAQQQPRPFAGALGQQINQQRPQFGRHGTFNSGMGFGYGRGRGNGYGRRR